MQSYKLFLVLKSSMADSDRKKFFETLKLWLKDSKIIKEDDWGQKPLSYSIKKENTATYIELMLESDAIPADFEKRLNQTDNVLRHLLVRN